MLFIPWSLTRNESEDWFCDGFCEDWPSAEPGLTRGLQAAGREAGGRFPPAGQGLKLRLGCWWQPELLGQHRAATGGHLLSTAENPQMQGTAQGGALTQCPPQPGAGAEP